MNKVSKTWSTEMDMNVRVSLGNRWSAVLEYYTDEQFSGVITGMLELIHPSNLELECIKLAAESGNRLRVFHNTLIAYFSSIDIIKDTQGQGVDQEDIDQHGLLDESYYHTLFKQISSDIGVAVGCPILNDMDYQDLIHTYSK